MLYIAVCDDEALYRDRITDYIMDYGRKHNHLFHVDKFSSGDDFVATGERMQDYDMLFLDLSMSGLSGLETASWLRRQCRNTYLVFVTAYMDFALDGYQYEEVRYIMKDEKTMKNRIEESLHAITDRIYEQTNSRSYPFREGLQKIADADIVMAESRLHDVCITVQSRRGLRTYTMSAGLNEVEAMLSESRTPFVRVQKSYLINLAFVKSIMYCEITMENGTQISISRSRYQEVKERFLLYKGGL